MLEKPNKLLKYQVYFKNEKKKMLTHVLDKIDYKLDIIILNVLEH